MTRAWIASVVVFMFNVKFFVVVGSAKRLPA